MSGSLARTLRAWPTWAVVAYTLLGWPAGIWLLTRGEFALNFFGVLLTAHTLVCSAYVTHECAHHAIFATATGNDRLGLVMSWMNGACLANYGRLKKKHLRHHADRLDVVSFDYRAVLCRSPHWVQRMVLALEWAYIPAVEFLMRGLIIATPFSTGGIAGRIRMLLLLCVRLALFAALAWVSVKAVILYAAAYLIFVSVLRFMDAFQHTYEVFASPSLEAAPFDPKRDLRYEYENTYSNLLAERWWWLNLMVLNFAYHNAHHVRPGMPWYKLRKLHQSLYGEKDRQVIACRELIAGYHRHRVARIFANTYGSVASGENRAGGFVGAVGVSFLTAV